MLLLSHLHRNGGIPKQDKVQKIELLPAPAQHPDNHGIRDFSKPSAYQAIRDSRSSVLSRSIVVPRLFTVAFILVLVLSGLNTGMASAQNIPVRGDNGWVLPERDSPSLSVGTAAAAPAATGSYTTYSDKVEQWRPAVQAACNFAGCEEKLMRVINCESQGNPYAEGKQGEYGLLQVKLWLWPEAGKDPGSQIAFAVRMFGSGQGGNWVCQ